MAERPTDKKKNKKGETVEDIKTTLCNGPQKKTKKPYLELKNMEILISLRTVKQQTIIWSAFKTHFDRRPNKYTTNQLIFYEKKIVLRLVYAIL